MNITNVYTSTNSFKLASHISQFLGVPLSQNIHTIFSNSEQKITITDSPQGNTCIFIHATGYPVDPSLMELFFTLDALKRNGSRRLVVVVPYLGYMRQDKQHNAGECISLDVIARLLKSMYCDVFITVNMHNNFSSQLFTLPITILDATPILTSTVNKMLKKIYTNSPQQIVVVAPDKGAVEQAQTFIQCLDISFTPTLAVIDKKRDKKTNKPHIEGVRGDFHNKIAIIVDDIITSGDTLFQTALKAKQLGAREVYGAVVHNDLIKTAYNKLSSSPITKLFMTDSSSNLQKNSKIVTCSIAELIGKELSQFIT